MLKCFIVHGITEIGWMAQIRHYINCFSEITGKSNSVLYYNNRGRYRGSNNRENYQNKGNCRRTYNNYSNSYRGPGGYRGGYRGPPNLLEPCSSSLCWRDLHSTWQIASIPT